MRKDISSGSIVYHSFPPRIHSILISNFLLGLRSVNPPTGDLSELGQQSSSVRFTDSMLGNIGASLDNTWALNVDDFEEEYPNNFDRNK